MWEWMKTLLIVLIAGIGLFFVRWHSKAYDYKCPKCNNVFSISTKKALLLASIFSMRSCLSVINVEQENSMRKSGKKSR